MTTAFVAEAFAAMNTFYSGKFSECRVNAAGQLIEAFAVAEWDASVHAGAWPLVIHRGRRSRHALVLLHDPAHDPAQLRPLAAALAAAGDDLSVVLPRLTEAGPARRAAWRAAVDHAVSVAALIGREVSIGGHGAGAALALDAAIRAPTAVGGRLALFSPLTERRPDPVPGDWEHAWDASQEPPLRGEVDALLSEISLAVAGMGDVARRGLFASVFVAQARSEVSADHAAWPWDAPGVTYQLPAALVLGEAGLVQDPQGGSTWAYGPPDTGFAELASTAAAFVAPASVSTKEPDPLPGEGRASEPATPDTGGNAPGEDSGRTLREEDDATTRLIDAQTASGTDPEEIRKVVRFANRARDARN